VQLHTRPVDFPPLCESAASQYRRVGLLRFESGRVFVFHGGRFWVLEPDEWETFKSGS
jgi:hypothetical protein